MHPALRSWRDVLPSTLVGLSAYLGGLAVLSIVAAEFFRSPPVTAVGPDDASAWIEIERPFPAFALAIPEAADAPVNYAIRRHALGGGRKDIVALGDPDSAAPYLAVTIYRPGTEIDRFGDPQRDIATNAASLGPIDLRPAEPLASKFGPLTIVTFDTSKGTPRHCLGFVRNYDDPRVQLLGWFCQGGGLVDRSTLACALDRLTLLAAGSDPKIGALFAQAELNRSYCGQRDPILASTPRYKTLWKALPSRPDPRRIGR